MTRFVAGWAALAVILTSANQLRSAAVPVGPGEVLLATWLMFVGFVLLRAPQGASAVPAGLPDDSRCDYESDHC